MDINRFERHRTHVSNIDANRDVQLAGFDGEVLVLTDQTIEIASWPVPISRTSKTETDLVEQQAALNELTHLGRLEIGFQIEEQLLSPLIWCRGGIGSAPALSDSTGTQTVPSIICSVFKQKDLALSLGATTFIEKPISEMLLINTLDGIGRN